MAISIGGLIVLIAVLLALALLLWLAFYILAQFPPPEPLGRLIRVVIVVVVVLVLIAVILNFAGIGTGLRLSS